MKRLHADCKIGLNKVIKDQIGAELKKITFDLTAANAAVLAASRTLPMQQTTSPNSCVKTIKSVSVQRARTLKRPHLENL
jgi:hypothetical protein